MTELLFGICGEVYAVLSFFLLKIVLRHFKLEKKFGFSTTFAQILAYQVSIMLFKYKRLTTPGYQQDVAQDFKSGVMMIIFLHMAATLIRDAVAGVKSFVAKTKTN